jgi:hypothetical protein
LVGFLFAHSALDDHDLGWRGSELDCLKKLRFASALDQLDDLYGGAHWAHSVVPFWVKAPGVCFGGLVFHFVVVLYSNTTQFIPICACFGRFFIIFFMAFLAQIRRFSPGPGILSWSAPPNV